MTRFYCEEQTMGRSPTHSRFLSVSSPHPQSHKYHRAVASRTGVTSALSQDCLYIGGPIQVARIILTYNASPRGLMGRGMAFEEVRKITALRTRRWMVTTKHVPEPLRDIAHNTPWANGLPRRDVRNDFGADGDVASFNCFHVIQGWTVATVVVQDCTGKVCRKIRGRLWGGALIRPYRRGRQGEWGRFDPQ